MAASSFTARRRLAWQSAADLLEQLGVDQNKPVDVFAAIEQLGLWLVFQPLQHLLGAVVPYGSGGVMLTSQRQPSVQRYTAAHEIGHWILDQDRLSCDTEDDIFTPSGEREHLAQLFASYFLMPPPLVHATATQHALRINGPAKAPQAYLIARDMNVSYEACVRQLANLQIVSDKQRDELLAIAPLRAKQALAHGHRLVNGYADVWPIDERALNHKLEVLLEDEIIVGLPENRTTGYRWIDDQALSARATRQRREPPSVLPSSNPSRPVPKLRGPRPAARTAADVTAALALLPSGSDPRAAVTDRDTGSDLNAGPSAHGTVLFDEVTSVPADPVTVVGDDYEPGWDSVTHRTVIAVRRRIAGDTAATLPPGVFARPNTADAEPRSAGLNARIEPRIGGTGRRWIALQATREGLWTYTLHYAATHDPSAPPAATFTVEAAVHPLPQVEHRRALVASSLETPIADGQEFPRGPEPEQ